MEKQDKRIDAYIKKASDFAQPILKHIRKLVHQASPEITETMKWSFPHFDYKVTGSIRLYKKSPLIFKQALL